MPPQPAEWLAELSSTQQQLWLSVKEAEFGSNNLTTAQAAFDKFINSKPPPGAKANAEYLLLLAYSRETSNDEALKVLAHSGWSQSDQVTDAGLPVGQLIWYQRLRLMTNGSGLARKRFYRDGLGNHVPPFAHFSTRLIEEVQRVCWGTGSETLADSLKGWWDAEQKGEWCSKIFANNIRPIRGRIQATGWSPASDRICWCRPISGPATTNRACAVADRCALLPYFSWP